MDGTKIQAKAYSGYGKAAKFLGSEYRLYRPNGSSNPVSGNYIITQIGEKIALTNGDYLVSANATLIKTMYAIFNAEDMKFSKPNKYGHPTWFGLFDGSLTQVGDYLVGEGGTFFIAAQQALLPILVVSCNRVITISRPAQSSGVGALGYGGNTPQGETAIMTNWPASILTGTKGEKSETGLPGDNRVAWWSVLVPYSENVYIKPFDLITDDLGNRYVISAPEQTDLGWRMTASMAVT